MPLEDDFRSLLLAELPDLAELDETIDHLVLAGLTAGYRQRRRRRISRITQAGGAALVAAIAVTGLVVVVQRSGGDAGSVSAGTRPTGVTVIDGIPSGVQRPVTEAGVKAALTTLLSRSGRVISVTSGVSPSGAFDAEAQYDDGLGVAAISVVVTPPRPLGERPSPPADFGKNNYCTTINAAVCTQSTLVDGSLLMSFQNGPNPQPWTAGELSAQHGRLDGSIVEVSEWNGATFKSSVATRQHQAFTTEQLVAFAESPLF